MTDIVRSQVARADELQRHMREETRRRLGIQPPAHVALREQLADIRARAEGVESELVQLGLRRTSLEAELSQLADDYTALERALDVISRDSTPAPAPIAARERVCIESGREHESSARVMPTGITRHSVGDPAYDDQRCWDSVTAHPAAMEVIEMQMEDEGRVRQAELTELIGDMFDLKPGTAQAVVSDQLLLLRVAGRVRCLGREGRTQVWERER